MLRWQYTGAVDVIVVAEWALRVPGTRPYSSQPSIPTTTLPDQTEIRRRPHRVYFLDMTTGTELDISTRAAQLFMAPSTHCEGGEDAVILVETEGDESAQHLVSARVDGSAKKRLCPVCVPTVCVLRVACNGRETFRWRRLVVCHETIRSRCVSRRFVCAQSSFLCRFQSKGFREFPGQPAFVA